jgi:hypothetical protein
MISYQISISYFNNSNSLSFNLSFSDNDSTSCSNPTSSITLDNPTSSITLDNPTSSITLANPISSITREKPTSSITLDNPILSTADFILREIGSISIFSALLTCCTSSLYKKYAIETKKFCYTFWVIPRINYEDTTQIRLLKDTEAIKIPFFDNSGKRMDSGYVINNKFDNIKVVETTSGQKIYIQGSNIVYRGNTEIDLLNTKKTIRQIEEYKENGAFRIIARDSESFDDIIKQEIIASLSSNLLSRNTNLRNDVNLIVDKTTHYVIDAFGDTKFPHIRIKQDPRADKTKNSIIKDEGTIFYPKVGNNAGRLYFERINPDRIKFGVQDNVDPSLFHEMSIKELIENDVLNHAERHLINRLFTRHMVSNLYDGSFYVVNKFNVLTFGHEVDKLDVFQRSVSNAVIKSTITDEWRVFIINLPAEMDVSARSVLDGKFVREVDKTQARVYKEGNLDDGDKLLEQISKDKLPKALRELSGEQLKNALIDGRVYITPTPSVGIDRGGRKIEFVGLGKEASKARIHIILDEMFARNRGLNPVIDKSGVINVNSMNPSRLTALRHMDRDKLNDFIDIILGDFYKYNLVNENVKYDHTNVREMYHEIFDLYVGYTPEDNDPLSSAPILFLDNNITSEEEIDRDMTHYELVTSIINVIENSPQFPFLQFLIKAGIDNNDQQLIELAVSTYMSRRLTGGYSALDMYVMSKQLNYAHQMTGTEVNSGGQSHATIEGSIKIIESIFASGSLELFISAETVALWKTEMYLFILTGQAAGMTISQVSNIFEYIPIQRPYTTRYWDVMQTNQSSIVIEGEEIGPTLNETMYIYGLVGEYLTVTYPMFSDFAGMVTLENYSPGDINSMLIGSIKNELREISIDVNATKVGTDQVVFQHLGYKAYDILDVRMNLETNETLHINPEFIDTYILHIQINNAVNYIASLYELIEGSNGQTLQNYLKDLYNVSHLTHAFESKSQGVDNYQTRILWASFVYDFFGRPRDYSILPQLDESQLLSSRFSLRVKNDPASIQNLAWSYDQSIAPKHSISEAFSDILFGRNLETFSLSDFIIGSDQGFRLFEYSESLHLMDLLRYTLVESEIMFVDSTTIPLFHEIWKDIFNSDISGLADLFSPDMIEMLAHNYIPFNTFYDPANPEKWTYVPVGEIDLAFLWQRATLAKFIEKDFSIHEGMHYKVNFGNGVDKYFEIRMDLIKFFTSIISRALQLAWMYTKIKVTATYEYWKTK